MKFCRNSLVLISLLSISSHTLAESDSTDTLDPVVVTATREETRESQIANTMTVITGEEIKTRRINTVAEILRVVPGLDVLSSGGPGQHTSVFTRGANSNQTLVMIDNIMMNDPSDPSGAFDFANLQVDNIERIEVLRGAASAMWGADAMGGVIHIITKHGSGKPKFTGLAEGGNYATWKLGGGVSGSEGNLNYTINASHFSNVGVSAAATSMGGNPERDPYQNTTVQARTNYQATDNLDLDWTLRYNNGQVGLDNCGGGTLATGYSCDNPYYWQNTNELYTRGQARLFLLDRSWEQRMGINLTQTNRQTSYSDPTAAAKLPTYSVQPFTSNGQQIKVEWINFFHITDYDTITAGMDGKFNTMTTDNEAFNGSPQLSYGNSINNGGYYLQNELNWLDRLHTTLGGRIDNNSLFGTHLTWRANQIFDLPELDNRIKANVGTAFTPPSLCDMNTSCAQATSNNLQPETSLDWDAGIEQDLFDKDMKLGVLYFHNNFKNLIEFVANSKAPFYGQLVNVSSATAQGIESFFEYKPYKSLSMRLNYTFDQTQGQWIGGSATNEPLVRRPKNKGNFDIDYHFTDKATAHVNVLVFGARTDTYFNQATYKSVMTEASGYVLVNLSANYELSDEVTLFTRLDNVLNKQYQQVWGYGTMGFTGIGGLNFKL